MTAWFLRAIEQAGGGWNCRHGLTVFDRHDELPDALEHLRDIATAMTPAELFVHRLDGSVQNLGPVEDRLDSSRMRRTTRPEG